MDALFDIQGRGTDHQFGPVATVFTSPYELRVQIGVASLIGKLNMSLIFGRHHRPMLHGRNNLASGIYVGDGFDSFRFLVTHHSLLPSYSHWTPNSSATARNRLSRVQSITLSARITTQSR